MPNVMVALPNIGTVRRRKVWLTLTTLLLCSNAAKTRRRWNLEGCPKLV